MPKKHVIVTHDDLVRMPHITGILTGLARYFAREATHEKCDLDMCFRLQLLNLINTVVSSAIVTKSHFRFEMRERGQGFENHGNINMRFGEGDYTAVEFVIVYQYSGETPKTVKLTRLDTRWVDGR